METVIIIVFSIGGFLISLTVFKCYRDYVNKKKISIFNKKLIKHLNNRSIKIVHFNEKHIQFDEQNNDYEYDETKIDQIRNTECVYV